MGIKGRQDQGGCCGGGRGFRSVVKVQLTESAHGDGSGVTGGGVTRSETTPALHRVAVGRCVLM